MLSMLSLGKVRGGGQGRTREGKGEGNEGSCIVVIAVRWDEARGQGKVMTMTQQPHHCGSHIVVAAVRQDEMRGQVKGKVIAMTMMMRQQAHHCSYHIVIVAR